MMRAGPVVEISGYKKTVLSAPLKDVFIDYSIEFIFGWLYYFLVFIIAPRFLQCVGVCVCKGCLFLSELIRTPPLGR